MIFLIFLLHFADMPRRKKTTKKKTPRRPSAFKVKTKNEWHQFSYHYHGLKEPFARVKGVSWSTTHVLEDIKTQIGRGNKDTALDMLISLCDTAQFITPHTQYASRRHGKGSIPPKTLFDIIHNELLPHFEDKFDVHNLQKEFKRILDHPREVQKELDKKKNLEENEFDFN